MFNCIGRHLARAPSAAQGAARSPSPLRGWSATLDWLQRHPGSQAAVLGPQGWPRASSTNRRMTIDYGVPLLSSSTHFTREMFYYICSTLYPGTLSTVHLGKTKIYFLGSTPIKLKLCEPQVLCIIRAHTKFQLPTCQWARENYRGISVQNPFWATNSGYYLTSARHMASGRVVEAHRTFQDHTLDALSSLMALGTTVLMLGWYCCCTVFTQFLFLPMTENRLCTSSVPIYLDG